jgi:glycosyltransferase involved in cell wall biosynthesis
MIGPEVGEVLESAGEHTMKPSRQPSRPLQASPRLWVVCAAYNEAGVIGGVVAELRRLGYDTIVVDDGSRDGTGAAALAGGAQVVTHPINLGQGAALQTGLELALARGAELLVTFDADGQHCAADIARLLDALAREQADFALGSRFLAASQDVPTLRRWVLKAATVFTRLTTGLRLTDSHNGLRAMTRRGASAICLRQNRMAHASEILAQIADSGLRYVEVPVTISYSAYSLAKGQRIADSILILRDLFAQELFR